MGSKRRRAAAQRLEKANEAAAALTADATSTATAGPSVGDMAGILVASMLILWRAQAYPIEQLWRDWVAIVSAYWIFTTLAGKSRAWPIVTVLVMGFLLVIFAQGNVPKVLHMLGRDS